MKKLSFLMVLAVVLSLFLAVPAASTCEHSYDNGFCTACDKFQPAELVSGVYQIGNAGQLYWFAERVDDYGYADISAVLTANIVVNEGVLNADMTPGYGDILSLAADEAIGQTRHWTPIDGFIGDFNGNGYTISGLYCVGTDNVGMFSVLEGAVHDLSIEDSYFCGSGTGVGAIAGELCGSIEGCSSAATVVGDSYVGGIVGWCRQGTAEIIGCSNSGIVSANVYAGGIVGEATVAPVQVAGCYNTGSVTASEIGSGGIVGFMDTGTWLGCYNVGTVTGTEDVGSIAGQRFGGSITNCYYLSGEGVGFDTTLGDGDTPYNGLMAAWRFESGEVAWRMNSVLEEPIWKQTLGTHAYPGFTGEGVYSYFACNGVTRLYVNAAHLDGTTMDHHFTGECDASCAGCDLIRPVTKEHTFDNILDTVCNGCGQTREKHVGKTLVKLDGVWHYVVNGELSDETTLVKYKGVWYYVKNGVKCADNTLVKYSGKWYHVNGGKLVNDTTLVKYKGEYYYVKNGVKCADNTLVKYNSKWYHVNGGKLVRDTTLVKYNDVWYYVKDGVMCNDNTLVKYSGKWYHVNGGKLVRDTTLVKYKDVWYYVKNGVMNTENTLVKYNSKWYHVNGGKLVRDTTLVKYSGKWYYVKNGVVDYTYSGKVLYKGTYYTVKNGVKI